MYSIKPSKREILQEASKDFNCITDEGVLFKHQLIPYGTISNSPSKHPSGACCEDCSKYLRDTSIITVTSTKP